MTAVEIIAKKRDGLTLSPDEISFMVQGFTNGKIPDYQVSAFLMAVYLKEMNKEETLALTEAMADSGRRLDLGSVPEIKVDKHSTGGVGDKTTIVLAPLVAAAGVPVAKISGRALGHTGGTLDKLESIPGMRLELSWHEFLNQVRTVGVAVAAQSEDMVPADKKLYALRDATATVASTSLIASSVMSKKIAAGADAIVLDIKTGAGAFMVGLQESLKLAGLMMEIGRGLGRKMAAVISDMDQPLGYAVGNTLEVIEATETLRGGGPPDLKELCLVLGSQMLKLAGVAKDDQEAEKILSKLLASGAAWKKFLEMVKHQGGDTAYLINTELFPKASLNSEILAQEDGFLLKVNARRIGEASLVLGAGRQTKEDKIDSTAGVVLNKKIGDKVEKGEVLAALHSNNEDKLKKGKGILEPAFSIGAERAAPPPLIHRILE